MESEIIGIYGQNGSGKTAVVEAMHMLRLILSGNPLPENSGDYIHQAAESAELSFEFDVQLHQQTCAVYYQAQLERCGSSSANISKEKLSCRIYPVPVRGVSDDPEAPVAPPAATAASKKETIIEFDAQEKGYAFRPLKNLKRLNHKSPENNVDLLVSKKMSQKNRTSFIFSDDTYEILRNAYDFADYRDIIFGLRHYAHSKLFIIQHGNGYQDSPLALREPSVVPAEVYESMKKASEQINAVLSAIIPGLETDIKNYGSQLGADGSRGIRIETVSRRQGLEIPMRYESDGIKKIISILSSMIKMYNDPSVCLVVDELDSGIFEYLLGELLEILAENARGQLIFTSHNLRPLEKLSTDSLIFTTTNPKNRYYRFSGKNGRESLRGRYYRCISLGGQRENLYEQTDHFEISRAFRTAGRMTDES